MSKRFDITIDGKNFTSDSAGFLDLNEIHKSLGLPISKKPKEWKKTTMGVYLSKEGYSTVGSKQRAVGNLKDSFVKGDEIAIVSYAQYVSIEFALNVIKAFVELRQGNLLEAAKIADSTQIESKAFSSWLEMEDGTIQQALKMLGINRPNFFQALIKKPSQKTSFLDRGILKQRNYGTHGVALRMTSFGKSYILDNRDTINNTIERLYQESKTPVM